MKKLIPTITLSTLLILGLSACGGVSPEEISLEEILDKHLDVKKHKATVENWGNADAIKQEKANIDAKWTAKRKNDFLAALKKDCNQEDMAIVNQLFDCKINAYKEFETFMAGKKKDEDLAGAANSKSQFCEFKILQNPPSVACFASLDKEEIFGLK